MEIIEQIGAYAGFAAVVGLAVLAALYFSQARDVKRLRDWAGRAPERAAQVEAEAQARAAAQAQAARAPATPAAQRVQGAPPAVPAQAKAAGAAVASQSATPAVAQAGDAAAAPAAQADEAKAQPGQPAPAPAAAQADEAKQAGKPAAAPAAAQAAGAPAGAAPAGATPAARAAGASSGQPPGAAPPGPGQGATATAPPAATSPPPAAAPKPAGNGAQGPPTPAKAPPIGGGPRVPSQPTAILPPQARVRRAPWYRRIHWPEARYGVLMVAGVLVLGGGAAFGVSQLLGEDEPSPQPAGQVAGDDDSGEDQSRPAPVNPSTVTVSVLNGTQVGGLARQIADRIESKGFQIGNIDNALDQAKAESVVLYAQGAKREAQAVGKLLGISQLEQVDPDSQARGGNASVVVIVGADQTL